MPLPLNQLVGVIDLLDGRAVHAIRGDRQRYQPRLRFRTPDGNVVSVAGDPVRLAQCYQQSGLQSLYVADLDGILRQRIDHQLIEHLIDTTAPETQLMLDLGLCRSQPRALFDRIATWAASAPRCLFVIATETCHDITLVEELLASVPAEQLAVSLDYHDFRWMASTTTEQQWLDTCVKEAISKVIALDLAAVGSQSIHHTAALCRRLRHQLPDCHYITGGGVRNDDDARELLQLGADQLLVASLFSDGG